MAQKTQYSWYHWQKYSSLVPWRIKVNLEAFPYQYQTNRFSPNKKVLCGCQLCSINYVSWYKILTSNQWLFLKYLQTLSQVSNKMWNTFAVSNNSIPGSCSTWSNLLAWVDMTSSKNIPWCYPVFSLFLVLIKFHMVSILCSSMMIGSCLVS